MTQELLKYQENNLLFVDIETAAQTNEFDENHPQFHVFQWKHRNKETDELLDTDEVVALYNRIAALSPIYGKVVCITVGYVLDGKAVIMTFSGSEYQIISDFYELLNRLGRTLVIWNADFDLPYVRKRAVLCGVDTVLSNDCGNDAGKKPWSIKGVLDLMQQWKGIGFYNDSLEEVAVALGLPSPKEDLRGSEVTLAFYNGRVAEIIKYCEADVLALINIFRTITFQDIISEVEIKQPENKNYGLLDRIKNKGRVTTVDQKLLANYKGDKEKLDNIVNSIL